MSCPSGLPSFPPPSPSLLPSPTQGYFFEVYQWVVNEVPHVVGGWMMKILVGSGLVFPPHDRVEPHVRIFNIPFYVVGCEATAEPTQSCSVFTTNVYFTLRMYVRTYVQMQVLCVYIFWSMYCTFYLSCPRLCLDHHLAGLCHTHACAERFNT